MPVIACPGCESAFQIPERLVGQSVCCPRCQLGFRAKSPSPPAPVAWDEGAFLGRPPGRKPVEMDLVKRAIQFAAARPMLMVVGAGVTLAAMLLTVAWLGPPEPGANWTIQELVMQCRGRGIRFEYAPRSAGGVFFARPGFLWKVKQFLNDDIAPRGMWANIVAVEEASSARAARRRAAEEGQEAFAFGRFVFSGDPHFLAEFRRALVQP